MIVLFNNYRKSYQLIKIFNKQKIKYHVNKK